MRWCGCIIGLPVAAALAALAWFLWSRTPPVTMTQGAVLWGTNVVPQPRRSGVSPRGVYMLRLDTLKPPQLVHVTSGTHPEVLSAHHAALVVVKDELRPHGVQTSSPPTSRVQHSYLLLDWRTGHTMPILLPDGELLSVHLGRSLALVRKEAHLYRAPIRVDRSRIVIMPTNRRALAPLPDWASAALSPNGTHVLIHDPGHGLGGHATIRSARDGAIVADFAATSAQFLEEGKGWFQVVYTSGGRLFLFDSRTRQARVLANGVGDERLVAASPDRKWVVTRFYTVDFREVLRGYPYLEHAKLRIRSAADGKVWRTWTAGNWVAKVVAASSD